MQSFVSPLPGIDYVQAWGPWAGTHRRGQNWQSGSGWDLLVPAGLPVVSPIAGRVVSVGNGGSGRFAGAKVGIQGADMSVFMTHLTSTNVVPGEQVLAGQQVGLTGSANGVDHLHIALGGPNYFDSSDANGIDPRPYLEASSHFLGKTKDGYKIFAGHQMRDVPQEALTLEQRLKVRGGFGGKSVNAIVQALALMDGKQPHLSRAKLLPGINAQLKKAGLGGKTRAKVVAGILIARRK